MWDGGFACGRWILHSYTESLLSQQQKEVIFFLKAVLFVHALVCVKKCYFLSMFTWRLALKFDEKINYFYSNSVHVLENGEMFGSNGFYRFTLMMKKVHFNLIFSFKRTVFPELISRFTKWLCILRNSNISDVFFWSLKLLIMIIRFEIFRYQQWISHYMDQCFHKIIIIELSISYLY